MITKQKLSPDSMAAVLNITISAKNLTLVLSKILMVKNLTMTEE